VHSLVPTRRAREVGAPTQTDPSEANPSLFLHSQTPWVRRFRKLGARTRIALAAAGAFLVPEAPAAEAGRDEPNDVRPYLHWRVGEFSPYWDVLDLRGISLGVEFNERWGAELALDAWQLQLIQSRVLGEQQIITLMPQVKFAIPTWNERIAPYAVAGVGGAWVQFNDRAAGGIGRRIDADGISIAGTAGLGLDLFLARNIALNLEGKYVWADSIGIRIDGVGRDWDPSSFLATIGVRVYLDRHSTDALIAQANLLTPVRFYFGTQGGTTFLTDSEWVSGAEIEPKLNAIGDIFNLQYTVSLGADLGEHFGLELALAHTEYTLRTATMGSIGEYSSHSVMPLLRLRFPRAEGRWVPYVMAGAGFCYSEFNDTKPIATALDIDAEGMTPAFSVGGGVDYFLARNLSLNAEGRWRYSWDHKIRTDDGISGKGDHSELQFTIGFRAYLWESR